MKIATIGLRAALMAASAALCLLLTAPGIDDSTPRTALRAHDRPGEADRFFYAQRVWPYGSAPAGWREDAMEHIRRMRPASMQKTADAWTWVSLGPANIAGRIRSLAMDPTNPAVLYAGSAGGGIWKTTDAGTTWRPLDDFLPNLRIGSIAVHPTDPSTVLAGNGEGFVLWQDSFAYGRGIYRSRDAGATWELIPATAISNFEFVFDIAFDPFDPRIVLAATKAGIMRSTDGGDSWVRLRVTFSAIRGMMSVFSRTTEGLVYCSIEGVGIFRSTDHGATWEGPKVSGITATNFSRIQLAAAPSNGDVVYAAFTANDESCAGVYRSSDRGDTWTAVTIPRSELDGDDYMREQGQYNSVLTVHPTNPNQVWAGGIDLYRSTNGGSTWKQMSNWYPAAGYGYVHADQHALLFNHKTPAQLFAACDGGIYRTNTSGLSWIDANAGLVTTQFHSGTPHPTNDVVLGGTIDNGNLRVSSGPSWLDVTGGDGGATAIDYSDPRIMYAELYYLDFMKSTLSGSAGTFQSKMNGIPRSAEGGTTDRCAFLPPFEMDPSDPKVLYAGTYRLYRTTNAAELWTPVSPDLSNNGFITAIGVSKSNPSVVYTGASSGVVYVTTNGGGNWTRVTTGLPVRYITDLAVNPTDPAVAYITFSGFRTGHVYKTSNFGAQWTNASGSDTLATLPDAPANTVVFHPGKTSKLYVGTDVGVFMTEDGGATWTPANSAMGNVTIADLQVRKDGTLFAATHGRGVFKSSYSLLDTQRSPLAEEFSVGALYPNPLRRGENRFVLPIRVEKPTEVTVQMYDANGRKMNELRRSFETPGSYNTIMPLGASSSGIYHCVVLRGEKIVSVRKLAVTE